MLRAKSKGVRFSHLLLIDLVVHGAAGLAEGHHLIYLAPSQWEREVFEFLDQHVSSAKGEPRPQPKG